MGRYRPLMPPACCSGSDWSGVVRPCPARSGSPGVAVVAIRRDLVKRDAGHRLGGAEERLCGCHVAMLAEQHIDQGPVSVDGAIQVGPVTAKLCKMAATLRNTR